MAVSSINQPGRFLLSAWACSIALAALIFSGCGYNEAQTKRLLGLARKHTRENHLAQAETCYGQLLQYCRHDPVVIAEYADVLRKLRHNSDLARLCLAARFEIGKDTILINRVIPVLDRVYPTHHSSKEDTCVTPVLSREVGDCQNFGDDLYPVAWSYYQDLLTLMPQNRDYYLRAIHFCMKNSDYLDALEVYRQAQVVFPSEEWVWQKEKAIPSYVPSQFEKSQDDLDKAIQINPQRSRNWAEKAQIFESAHRLNDALGAWDMAIKLETFNRGLRATYLFNKAQCLIALGRLKDSFTVMNAALQSDSTNPFVHRVMPFLLRELHYPLKQQLAAIDEDILRISPSIKDGSSSQLAFRAEILYDMEEYDKALEYAEIASRRDRKNTDAQRILLKASKAAGRISG